MTAIDRAIEAFKNADGDGVWYEHEIIGLLEEIKARGDWVSVDERLPEKEGHVLAVHCGKAKVAWFDPEDKKEPFTYYGLGCRARLKDTTHHQPLPEPPKGGCCGNILRLTRKIPITLL